MILSCLTLDVVEMVQRSGRDWAVMVICTGTPSQLAQQLTPVTTFFWIESLSLDPFTARLWIVDKKRSSSKKKARCPAYSGSESELLQQEDQRAVRGKKSKNSGKKSPTLGPRHPTHHSEVLQLKLRS